MRVAKPASSPERRRLSFTLQLLLALAVTMVAVAVGEQQLLTWRLEHGFVADAESRHRADARYLERAVRAADDGEDALEEAQEVVDSLASRPGVRGAYLVDDRGVAVAAAGEEPVGAHREGPARTTRSAEGGGEGGEGEADASFEWVTAVTLPSGRYALQVDEDRRALDGRLADLRRDALLVLLVGVLVAMPLFYLVGGRRMGVLHRAALERSTRDGLTDVGNHRAFQDELRLAAASAVRHVEPLCLVLVDLDDFKFANDRHGHQHGDQVLREVAALLVGARADDRVFRLGGDEFALILPRTSVQDATVLCDRLRAAAPERLGGLTLSIGVAGLTGDGDVDALLQQADAALYEAKRRGRDAVVAFDEVEAVSSLVTAEKVRAVRRLMDEGTVGVAFQPIWDLERQRPIGYEALARPAGVGLAGPGEAFELAERIGRAHELDALCRRVILDRASELPADTLLFLNVSPQTLDHDLLAGDRLVRAVRAAGLEPDRVVLEITERSSARIASVVAEAHRLSRLGFRIALDDVGAGNAGLEMLRSLRVDFVKIDRLVVAGAMTESSARAVLLAIIAFASEMDAFVIAEGIETEAMLELVRHPRPPDAERSTGVRGAQGYLLGRPAETVAIPEAAARQVASVAS